MNKSETIGKLAEALSKLQGEIENVQKDKQGYGYKYTELSSILDMIRPLCAKYELAHTQLCWNPTDNNGVNVDCVGVETVLLHTSGEWLSSTFFMKIEQPISKSGNKSVTAAQASGMVITYARRYALAAILGIAQTDNDAAVEKVTEKPKVTSALYASLCDMIIQYNLDSKINEWCKYFKVIALDELNDNDIQKLINKIEEANNGSV